MNDQYRGYPIEALIEQAKKLRSALYHQYALHLCQDLGLQPDAMGIGEPLCHRTKDTNVQAAKLWLQRYLCGDDILGSSIDLNDCTSEFRRDVHDCVPPHLWGEIEIVMI